MHSERPQPSQRRIVLGTIGFALGGLAPLATGLVGFWGYATQGYFIARTGERVDGPLGLVTCGLFVLAGLWMIVHALRTYRRKTTTDPR